jgi:hypothetical protein
MSPVSTATIPLTRGMLDCVRECGECARLCLETITHCLLMGGRHAEADHIRVLRDCAAICEASAKLMLHGSPFHTETCGLCAEVCTACAESCERFGEVEMDACADACRSCAESCEAMTR